MKFQSLPPHTHTHTIAIVKRAAVVLIVAMVVEENAIITPTVAVVHNVVQLMDPPLDPGLEKCEQLSPGSYYLDHDDHDRYFNVCFDLLS